MFETFLLISLYLKSHRTQTLEINGYNEIIHVMFNQAEYLLLRSLLIFLISGNNSYSRGMAYLHNEPNVIIHRDLKPR